MKSVFQLIASVACAFALTACGSAANEKKDVVIDPATQVKELVVTDLTVGTGATAASGDTLIVTYTGWLYNSGKTDNKGTQFDATKPGAGFQVVLGKGTVIPGWDRGLVGMKVGGTRRLTIPYDLGYGPNGSLPAIPAYAGLVFDISLVTVTKP
ncbi:FKBP-type peptidyl-prolyl cis-trans isomerase [Janthinobacterium psychrotolerans]|uniref:Peptidyl-prolyl cis-trans isomerase n=1 Tax=Janthinobacterium psychrotolerans TaxID=1747903 RepID=A0A1A7C131_9BURK|nr:FKBP-type peptidyl-prolyl cis-trans isomerase [Janthinobacterium psychrotolerans]OBV39452.1 FKBP-type peptidyl-prolyl cis-trans isomerase FkpA [Janthinobacterium psychrotolerans]